MQLPNSTDQSLNTTAARVLKVLEDIENHVQILDSFHFSHPRYSPLELEPEIFNSLQQLSTERQDEYLRWRLGSYLLSLYEAGDNAVQLEPKSEAASFPIQDGPVQNTALGLHSPFYGRLHGQNVGKGYFDPGWRVLRQAPDGLYAVHKDGLTLHVGDRHLQSPAIAIGDTISIRLPSNRMDQGCYVALSNVGPLQGDGTKQIQPIQLYFNLNLEGIIEGMQYFTHALNALNLPFMLTVPHDEKHCQEICDAITLTINKGDYGAIQPVLEQFYRHHADRFQPEVPLFAKPLAPGLGLAEQPLHPFLLKESFGMNRFQVVAEGLINAWRQGHTSASARESSILQSFSHYKIDLNYPYLSFGEDDCYSVDLGLQ
jgi:hypothetical protein